MRALHAGGMRATGQSIIEGAGSVGVSGRGSNVLKLTDNENSHLHEPGKYDVLMIDAVSVYIYEFFQLVRFTQ